MTIFENASISGDGLEWAGVFSYIKNMKKQIYFTVIGIGALLAIIGFIPGGMSGLWGVLIAGVTGLLYYFNVKNERKVQERLEEEKEPVDQAPVSDKPDDSGEEETDEEADE